MREESLGFDWGKFWLVGSFRSLMVFLLVMGGVILIGLSKVPAGYVGVKVYLLGQDKGVDAEVKPVGRYWIGWNEELYIFPTFQQTTSWTKEITKESPNDQSFTFQTKEGLSINADVSISYTINPEKVADLFQRYRKGVDEITDLYLRNVVRDALVQASSKRGVESIYGLGKNDLLQEVNAFVRAKMAPIGIDIDMISFVGDLRLPESVIASIDAKIVATQRAQQRENELRETKAQVEKELAITSGSVKKAKMEADALILVATGQAEANKRLAESITPQLIVYKLAETWEGKLPQVLGGEHLLQLPLRGSLLK